MGGGFMIAAVPGVITDLDAAEAQFNFYCDH